RWVQACDAMLQRLVKKAVAMPAEELERADVKLSAKRKDDVVEVTLTIIGPQSTIIRLVTKQNQPPTVELGTAVQRGVGRVKPQIMFTSRGGLSARSTRATVAALISAAEQRLGIKKDTDAN